MIATIVSNQSIVISNITDYEAEIVSKRFSAVNPNQRFVDSSYQCWDGVYRRFNKATGKLARPFLGELRKLCRDKKLQLTVIDDRGPSNIIPIDMSKITPNMLTGITLKDFQVNAIKMITNTEVGIFHIPVSGGKTELMAGMCKAVPCRTAIIAEQLIIIDQIKKRLQLRDVADEIGLFYAGKTPTDQLVIIGSIQSLVSPKDPGKEPIRSKYKTEKGYNAAIKRYTNRIKAYKSRKKKSDILHKLIGLCDMIFVDEADLATSATYKSLFRYWFKGRRRYGFTGTPFEPTKPVNNLILQEHFGSVIYKQSRQQIEDAGLAVPISYHMVVFGDYKDKNEASAYDIAVDDYIVYNKDFHALIANLCAKITKDDDGTLILVGRDDLGHALKELIPNSDFIHGMTPKKKRPIILKEFEDRKINVLIGGKNVRRGLDLRGGCENLVIATGGKNQSEFEQAVGRGRRLNKRGMTNVYDIYFLCNRYLYAHSRTRLKTAIGMGCDTEIIFDDTRTDGVIDGSKFVRSQFRIPKRLI